MYVTNLGFDNYVDNTMLLLSGENFTVYRNFLWDNTFVSV